MANYELRIETSEMKKALDVLSSVVNKKNSLPIMACACIRYDRSRKLFTMTAGNTEQWLTLECWKKDEKADRGYREWMFLDKDSKEQPLDGFCIMVDAFREVFASLPALPAQCYLKIDEQGGSMRVNYSKGECTMPVNDCGGGVADYPEVPAVVEKNEKGVYGAVTPVVKFSIETKELLPIISAARVCSANDELRPVMNTVCVDCFHDHAVVVASDGHSLFKKSIDTGMGWLRYGEFPVTDPETGRQGSAKVLIPKQALTPLAKALDQSESITLTADTQRISVQSSDGGIRLTTVCIDGNYPNYESVIPKDNRHQLLIDRQELSATLRRISLFSAEGSNLAILRRDDEHVILNASDEGYGRNADEHVAIINSESTSLPEGFQIGFKIATMQLLLGCIQGDNVMLELGEPNRAMLVKEDAKVSSVTLLIMPMLVNG